ncbi:hypothetical protein HELRODRAFT_185599 [Helobdella robusta]|uniref:Osteoclast-stimulating factor 1 n=1 Tax=Helobdella robusta TaxID=6412 RepID=T1FN08_HELRO|nr:hypothetical protein HELRODRAFT_185599 [Helobdella robusta]ESO03986.1 hypothetical protein HELRODRAFT_185599 [Helobdella robusta]
MTSVQPSRAAPPKPVPKPGQVKVVRALYKYDAQQADELSFDEGELLYILDMSNPDWWKAKCGTTSGLVPSNYVQESMESIENPLHEAAKRGNIEFMEECLQNKVSVNGLDKSASTPLHWACHGGHLDCARRLLSEPQCQMNVQNKLGDTPLHSAAWKGHLEVVELLVNRGASTNVRNNEKQLAFDLAKEPKVAALLQPTNELDSAQLCSDYGADEDSD